MFPRGFNEFSSTSSSLLTGFNDFSCEKHRLKQNLQQKLPNWFAKSV